MTYISKLFLIFNTVKYLKLQQLFYQFLLRLRPKEQFWKYYKSDVRFNECNLWIDGLDNEKTFIERFKPDKLLNNKVVRSHLVSSSTM